MTARASSAAPTTSTSGQDYFLFAGFPLRPFFSRETIVTEVVKNKIWSFEQPQGLGFSNVTINVRMTVIRLRDGRLWVHAPVAPTKQCVRMLKQLGEVAYIVLPTFAIEHKVYVAPFARKFPKAEVWVAPGQWSWPLNLPLPFLGIFGSKLLKSDDPDAPWADEIEQKVFVSAVGVGPYVETAFFHKQTSTLLVTDAVVKVPEDAPAVVRPSLLLDAARPNPFSPLSPVPEDSVQARRRGWRRMVLQVLFFGPGNLLEPDESFNQISGKLIVSPVVRTLVFSNVPKSTREWVEGICKWRFNRIIPAHLSAPIPSSPGELKTAFAFAYGRTPGILGTGLLAEKPFEFPEGDMKVLDGLEELVKSSGILNEASETV